MNYEFAGEVWFWRGPSPFHFVTVPEVQSGEIKGMSALLTYGWGVIPALVRIGNTEWSTSLIPKQGRYLVPLKDLVRKSENITVGDRVQVQLSLKPR